MHGATIKITSLITPPKCAIYIHYVMNMYCTLVGVIMNKYSIFGWCN
jgi:hypothetical protein